MKLANQDRSRRSTPSSTAAVLLLLLLVGEYGLAKAWRAVRALAQALPL
jgi:hypothetical protein